MNKIIYSELFAFLNDNDYVYLLERNSWIGNQGILSNISDEDGHEYLQLLRWNFDEGVQDTLFFTSVENLRIYCYGQREE